MGANVNGEGSLVKRRTLQSGADGTASETPAFRFKPQIRIGITM
jgi:hypothetical protein